MFNCSSVSIMYRRMMARIARWFWSKAYNS